MIPVPGPRRLFALMTLVLLVSCERLIGSIRRECTDYVIVLSERHLRRVLRAYVEYYQESRTHRALGNDAPVPRAIEPPQLGESSSFQRSVVSTIGTLDAPPDPAVCRRPAADTFSPSTALSPRASLLRGMSVESAPACARQHHQAPLDRYHLTVAQMPLEVRKQSSERRM